MFNVQVIQRITYTREPRTCDENIVATGVVGHVTKIF